MGRFLHEEFSEEEFSDDEFSDEDFKLPTYLNLKQTNGEISPLLVQIYKIYGQEMSLLSTPKDPGSKTAPCLELREAKRHERLAVLQQTLEAEFFNNEYWSRAWITQEIFVAKHAVVMLEKEELSIAACINVLWGCDKAAVHDNKIVNKFASYLGFDNSGLPSIQLGGTSKSFLSLLRQFSDKDCAIPRDRLYSLLSLYSDGGKVAVDYAQPDDELLCHVAKCLYEPVGLCSIINLARSLMPQSESLGIGFIDIDLPHLVLEWEPADAFICQHTMSRAQSQYTFRKLLDVKFSKTSCIFLPKVLEMLHGRATLIESWPTAEEEPDFTCYGERMMAVSISESGAQFDDIMSRSGKNVGPSTLRMYAHDFGIWMANKEDNIWTVRIRLSLLWKMFGTANAKELCNSLHRFSYGGICTHVRLGCGPLNLGLRV
ncbi:uncharacterized protein ALTATR162_LOCUS9434 [Alternaria atra]|uniref:Heterokaryon incompatibility domain-containing protein n=1 Tax=Alternaria atra TaxID=119953 RepID=A0A8J2N9S4_9PLEO|nr:uncharacterized protein ALTATR162_LOCUS9434 [Alternaria atra]CAG5180808.1 unnamed protein product [Alternaria atra]